LLILAAPKTEITSYRDSKAEKKEELEDTRGHRPIRQRIHESEGWPNY
jgi:hypothetical protein